MRKKLVAALVIATAGAFLANAGFTKCVCQHKSKFINAEGKEVGFVQLRETPQGVIVHAELEGLPEGWHGFHLHTTGKCDPPDFTSAGGHYNPLDHAHGMEAPQGPHLGDLPNIWVNKDGKAKVEVFAAHVSLQKDAKNTLMDADGTAIVVHAQPDDYESQPAGDAGSRIACAVVQ